MFSSTAERKWVIRLAIVLLLVTSLPYCFAYSQSDINFSGFLLGVEDGNSYIAKMLSGAEGAWLFRSPYTAHPQQGFLAFFPYILMGKWTSQPAQHEQLVFLFHLYRWVAGILCVIATYLFTAIFLKREELRKIVVVIALVGGGFGWLSVFGIAKVFSIDLPLEFYSPETFGFLSLLGLPHLLAARAFMLLGFVIFFNKGTKLRNQVFAGFCWFMIGFFQPLTIVTGWAVLGGYLGFVFLKTILFCPKQFKTELVNWMPRIKTSIWMVILSSPWVLYNLLSFSYDPYLAGWAAQNLITSPPVIDYLFSFSLLIPFVLMGLWRTLLHSKNSTLLLPAIFILFFPLLAYFPHNLQRRFPDGIWLALAILAMSVFDSSKQKRSLQLPFVLLIISLITPLLVLAGGFQAVIKPDLPLFRPIDEIKAFEFLAKTAPRNSLVMASYEISNALPAWAPVRVLAGHGPESIHLAELSPQIDEFLSGAETADQQMLFLNEYSVDYILVGPLEAHLHEVLLVSTEYLKKVYDRQGYSIYWVQLTTSNGNKTK